MIESEISWRTSSYSATQGACVEIGWQKSSYTGANGDCVEVASKPQEVLVRDTKDRAGGTLSFGQEQWRALQSRLAARNALA